LTQVSVFLIPFFGWSYKWKNFRFPQPPCVNFCVIVEEFNSFPPLIIADKLGLSFLTIVGFSTLFRLSAEFNIGALFYSLSFKISGREKPGFCNRVQLALHLSEDTR
jgi:hypothetical protein